MKTILVDAWNTFYTESGINVDMKKILDKYSNDKSNLIQILNKVQETYRIYSKV